MSERAPLPFSNVEQLRAWFDVYAMTSHAQSTRAKTPTKRLARMRRAMERLGNPQEKIKVIHVAGTTGKGSTCLYLESLLRAHGFKTGLTVSPHAVDVRERFQINGRFISDQRLLELVTGVFHDLLLFDETSDERPGYFELLMAMAYRLFSEEGVDYAVVETGVGGRFDPSNVIQRSDKYCVITKLGLDHQTLLGSTIEEIARQKLGIIQPGTNVLIGRQELISQESLELMAREEGAGEITYFDEHRKDKRIDEGEVPYLKENAELAVGVCEALAARDGWGIDLSLVRIALANTVLPLRFERIEWKGKTIILDAAHNGQKMKGLSEALQTLYPNQSVAVVLAFGVESTSVKEMLREIVPLATEIAVADFIVGSGQYRFRFMDPNAVVELLGEGREKVLSIKAIHTLSDVILWVESVPVSVVVVTGSFHFASMVRAAILDVPAPW